MILLCLSPHCMAVDGEVLPQTLRNNVQHFGHSLHSVAVWKMLDLWQTTYWVTRARQKAQTCHSCYNTPLGELQYLHWELGLSWRFKVIWFVSIIGRHLAISGYTLHCTYKASCDNLLLNPWSRRIASCVSLLVLSHTATHICIGLTWDLFALQWCAVSTTCSLSPHWLEHSYSHP